MPPTRRRPPLCAGDPRLWTGFAVAWLASLLPFLVSGQLPGEVGSDTNRLFVPFREWLIRQAWGGNFPDLASGMFLGHPILSLGQFQVFYPTNLLGILVPVPHLFFFWVDLWVHMVVGSVGCACLLDRLVRHRGAALALGWVYPNTSAMLLRTAGHWTLLHEAAVLPWLVSAWLAVRCPDGPGARTRWRQLGVLGGLVLLGQNPQWPYILVLLLVPMELWRFAGAPSRWRSRLAGLCLAGALAACLAAAALLPPLLWSEESFRAEMRGGPLGSTATMAPLSLVALPMPLVLFGGSFSMSTYMGDSFPCEALAIVGRAPLLLAIVGLSGILLGRRPREGDVLALLFVVGGLAIGMGNYSPVFALLLRWAPMFDAFRAWGRASWFVDMGLLLLAARGFVFLVTSRRMRLATGLVLGPMVTATMAWMAWNSAGADSPTVSWLLSRGANPAPLQHDPDRVLAGIRDSFGMDAVVYLVLSVASLAAPVRRGLAIGAVAAAEALWFQRFVWQERSPCLSPGSHPALRELLEGLVARRSPEPVTVALLPRELSNFALMVPGLRNTHGGDSNLRRSYGVWINTLQGQPPGAYQLDINLPRSTPEFVTRSRLEGIVAEDLPPFRAAGFVPVDGYAFQQLRSPGPYAAFDGAGSARVEDWSEDEVTMRVEVPAGGGNLHVAEWGDRHWRARADGTPVAVRDAGTELVLTVPPGAKQVTLFYVDMPARLGMAISATSWMALAVGWGLRRRKG